MNLQKKIIYINLAILVAIAFIFLIASIGESGNYAGMGYGLLMMVYPPVHAVICFIIGMVFFLKVHRDERNKQITRGFFISAGLIAVIGPSLCFGGIGVIDAS